MILASGFFSVMFALVKGLGPELPFSEMVFFRALFSLPVIFVLIRRRKLPLRPRQRLLMLARGLLGLTAMSGYFFALQRGVMANIAVIARIQPIFVTFLSPLLVGDQIPRVALLTLAMGFGGALLVIKPAALSLLDLACLLALGSAVFSALAHLAVRRLNTANSPEVIVLYFTLIIGIGGGLMSVPVFVLPDLGQWLFLASMALCATGGQILMTMAYSRDSAPVVSAAAYSIVLFALLFGYLFWRELPDALSLMGGAVIVVAGILLAYARRTERVPPTLS
jgi:drug/metabolite transporter (DMT)-like permease